MSESGDLRFYDCPGGRKSVAGGTRNTIKLDRPWQKEIEVNSEKCGLCKKPPEDDISFIPEDGGWRLTRNSFTPFPYHFLAMPKTCWPVSEMRTLGGQKKIEMALGILDSEITKNADKKLFINVHIGALAGQNIAHLHYHLVQYMFDDDASSLVKGQVLDWKWRNPELVVLDNGSFNATVGGVRAGQCFILDNCRSGYPSHFSHHQFSCLITELIERYSKKFQSIQGLPPDFSLGLYFHNSLFEYAIYTPILNHWGAAEQIAVYENCPIALPWPHELTAEHLKE